MRKLTQLVLVAAAMMATPAFAEMKIAVMNYQMALLESDAAKKYAVDAEKKFGPQLNKLKQLEADAKRIQDRLVKDAEKMQQAERERLELEFKQKARDFQFHPNQVMTEMPDGSLLVEFSASGWVEMAWHLISWGRAVEVQEPPELRIMLEKVQHGDVDVLP